VDLAARYRGAMLGLAAGDAVGTTVEFSPPGTFRPLVDMVGGGPFRLPAGAWTDDTSMALCLGESLLARRGFDAADQLRRYVRWWREGHRSSTGTCFDIGGTVREALARFERDGDPETAGADHERAAGNGTIMRLAPVPLAFRRDPWTAVAYARASAATTHRHPEAMDGARYLAGLILGALGGASKAALLGGVWSPYPGCWEEAPLAPAIAAVAEGSFRRKSPPAIRGTGYVVDSLEAALWAFDTTDTFEAGALAAANLGDDADTTAAVYGQLAGAYYGEAGIPRRWRDRLVDGAGIAGMADDLLALSNGLP
jgi:ADP-ribosylglycohydrolase